MSENSHNLFHTKCVLPESDIRHDYLSAYCGIFCVFKLLLAEEAENRFV